MTEDRSDCTIGLKILQWEYGISDEDVAFLRSNGVEWVRIHRGLKELSGWYCLGEMAQFRTDGRFLNEHTKRNREEEIFYLINGGTFVFEQKILHVADGEIEEIIAKYVQHCKTESKLYSEEVTEQCRRLNEAIARGEREQMSESELRVYSRMLAKKRFQGLSGVSGECDGVGFWRAG